MRCMEVFVRDVWEFLCKVYGSFCERCMEVFVRVVWKFL